jgi:hypothetical protein
VIQVIKHLTSKCKAPVLKKKKKRRRKEGGREGEREREERKREEGRKKTESTRKELQVLATPNMPLPPSRQRYTYATFLQIPQSLCRFLFFLLSHYHHTGDTLFTKGLTIYLSQVHPLLPRLIPL